MKWGSKSQLENLLNEVVGWESQTGTEGEISFAPKIKDKLMELDYFQQHPSHVQFHEAGKSRNAVSALYKHENAKKTVTLISHFDTVHTREFGMLKDLAFQPQKLTEKFKEIVEELPEDARNDVMSNEYLFGRGTMDMKMGLVLHLHLIETASIEDWPINLLLVTVPDEEVNSAGMRAVVRNMVKLRNQFNLEYTLFLNSEPSFSQHPGDENYYIYSGTIGKIMPSALFYGKETHAGEPLSGINAHYMASFLTNRMEYVPDFMEEVYGERTPLPVCLKTYDLKQDYSTQTSNHAAAFYNVFLMKNNASDIMTTFRNIANESMEDCQQQYEDICHRENVQPVGNIKVLDYSELIDYAVDKIGNSVVEEVKSRIINNTDLDEREMSIHICDELLAQCQELAPAVVLFFAPPYYPAINSSKNPLVKQKIEQTQEILQDKFNVEAKQVHYFNGISDLSYINYDKNDIGWKAFKNNLPVWEGVYSIPFEEMQQLQAPVLNIGPFGKDAHKLTERLHKASAFEQTPYVLREIITSLCKHSVH
ncbi:M20/M25/M40 family metallo-hydrolase [Lentibacillus lipolyticus]|nr:M20/M25/M40 family metallo-hydrolase [Lentibacillus lipolyticus]